MVRREFLEFAFEIRYVDAEELEKLGVQVPSHGKQIRYKPCSGDSGNLVSVGPNLNWARVSTT